MIIHENRRILSECDSLPLDVLIVRPEEEPIGLVQFAHGMCEHKERYIPFMEFLADHGIACVINDHRGHGNSVLTERDLGYFYKNGAKALICDMHQITVWMRDRWPNKQLIMLGHSMGALAVRVYAGQYAQDIDGLIIVGSPGENPVVGLGLALVHIETALFGPRYRSRLMYSMSIGTYEGRYKDQGRTAWLSVNTANRTEYEKDPLCSFRFTLNGYLALLHLLRDAYQLPQAKKASLPVRFYSGSDDPCAPDAKGFKNAIEKMRSAGYTDVQGYMFEGLRHEILRENDKESVFEMILHEAILPVINSAH